MIECKYRTEVDQLQCLCNYGRHQMLITINNCDRCQAQPETYWPDETREGVRTLANRSKCEHLGKVLARSHCNCWQKDRYLCDLGVNGRVGVRPMNECETCDRYEKVD